MKTDKEFGGRDRVRTCDPLLAKQVLSQLSYTPTAATSLDFKAFCRLTETQKGHGAKTTPAFESQT
jgi:hypothetical protein